MASRTLLAVCTSAGYLSLTGCAALGLLGGVARMDAATRETRSGSPPPLPGGLADAGHSIFDVVAWGMAVILGALVLAFVARLLNGRTAIPRPTQTPPERAPESAARSRYAPAEIGGGGTPRTMES